VLWATLASAQTSSPRWEIEPYGGLSAPFASAGSVTLPAAGAPIVTSNPTFPSRAVPSWFFGDGAALLNGVNGEFMVASRIAPLDGVFQKLHPGGAAIVGIRVRRRLTRRCWVEVDFGSSTSRTVGGNLAPAVEVTRGSFESAFRDLFASGPFGNVDVAATGGAAAGRVRDVHATVAVNTRLRSWSGFDPDVTFGGGVLASAGALPSATLDGHYRLAILGQVPIDESDHMTMRYTRGASIVGVAGVGVTRGFNDRWALRADARWLLGPDGTRIVVDAAPSSARGTPAGFVESFTNPAIQFSNDPSTGRVSSLSAALQGTRVFSGGFQVRSIVTVGIVRRF
jgi:hypothetical protein